MARPGIVESERPAGERTPRSPRLAHLDRDRPLVEAAQRDPARFDALYRRYLAQVYSYAYYELGDHHDAEDATERTFLAALANLGRFEERARPGRRRGRLDVPRLALPDRPERGRRPAPRRGAAARRRRSRPRARRRPARRRGRRASARRGGGRVARRRPAARRPPPGAGPALRRRDVHRGDRRRPRPVRGRGPGPDPSRAAERRPDLGGRTREPSIDRERDAARSRRSSPTATSTALLAGAARRGDRPPATPTPALDPAARAAARPPLAATCPRFHPSFRFEERLALRLAEAAAAMRLPVAAGGEGRRSSRSRSRGRRPTRSARAPATAMPSMRRSIRAIGAPAADRRRAAPRPRCRSPGGASRLASRPAAGPTPMARARGAARAARPMRRARLD